MTPETILSLLCKLNDTIDAQQRQIDQLTAQLAQQTAGPDPKDADPCPTTTGT